MKGIQRARRLRVQGCDTQLVSSAGAALLIETAGVSGLAGALSTVLKGWWRPRAAHDPGKVLLDVAIALGLGGGCRRTTSRVGAGTTSRVGLWREDHGIGSPPATRLVRSLSR